MPPGGEGEVKAVLRTKGRSGPLKKKITVFSNDPDSPKFMLNLHGEIVVDVEVKPRAITFGQLGKGEKSFREFTTKVTEPHKNKIVSVAIDEEHFKINKKSGKQETGAKYEIQFLGSKELGRISSKILITYEEIGASSEAGPKTTTIETPVRVNTVGNLRYSKNLYFLKRNDKFKSREIVLTTRSGDPIKIKGVTDPDKQLKLEVIEPEGQRVMVRAEVAKPDASYPKPSRHTLQIKTTDKDEPVVEIGYTISEKRPGPKRLNANRTMKPFMKRKGKGLGSKAPKAKNKPSEVPK
ncbi:MAG: DUF1573 domain-containing protein [Deltaproteobacteria bacterium]|nr:DUF1573 domain-containing protein [Deltaproteobacteria bacterium]